MDTIFKRGSSYAVWKARTRCSIPVDSYCLEHMGICLDDKRNETVVGDIAEIQQDGSAVRVLVVRTDEEREIARQTIHTIEKAGLKIRRGL